jgi:hypothetical protein
MYTFCGDTISDAVVLAASSASVLVASDTCRCDSNDISTVLVKLVIINSSRFSSIGIVIVAAVASSAAV